MLAQKSDKSSSLLDLSNWINSEDLSKCLCGDKYSIPGLDSSLCKSCGWQSQPQSQPSEPARLKNWTPPELYPQMTQAEFEAIPVDEQWLYLESPQERRNRQRQELREIGYWTSRKHG